jgi:ATP-dependent protease ClpP protease subunit
MNPTLYHRSPWMTITLAEAAADSAVPAVRSTGTGVKGYKADILLNGPIGQWDYAADSMKEGRRLLKEEVRKELSALAGLGAAEITVEINSLGGSFQHAIAIHDYLAQFPGKVTTRVIGMTASAATVVAQAGRVRQISANALYLIHRSGPPYGYANAANAVELRAAADGYETLDRQMSAIYAKRSGAKEADVWAVMNEDNGNGRWMTADHAKELGLVDEIFEPVAAAASVAVPGADLADAVAAAHLPPLPGALGTPNSGSAHEPLGRAAFPASEQSASQVTGAAGVAASTSRAQHPTGAQPVKITAAQATTLKARFGADFAFAAITGDMEYAAALEQGSEAQAAALATAQGQLTTLATERDQARAEAKTAKDALATAKAGLADPLAASDPKNPPADPKSAAAQAAAAAEAKADAEKLKGLVAAANAQ